MAGFDIQDYYTSEIADKAGILQHKAECLIAAKIIPKADETASSLEELDKQIDSLKNLDSLREYEIYSLPEIAEKTEIDENNLITAVKSGKLRIPNHFMENKENRYALTKDTLKDLKIKFNEIWESVVKSEQEIDEEDDASELSHEKEQKEQQSTSFQKDSQDTPAVPVSEADEEEKQEKKEKKKDRREKQRKEERIRQQREEKNYEERKKNEEKTTMQNRPSSRQDASVPTVSMQNNVSDREKQPETVTKTDTQTFDYDEYLKNAPFESSWDSGSTSSHTPEQTDSDTSYTERQQDTPRPVEYAGSPVSNPKPFEQAVYDSNNTTDFFSKFDGFDSQMESFYDGNFNAYAGQVKKEEFTIKNDKSKKDTPFSISSVRQDSDSIRLDKPDASASQEKSDSQPYEISYHPQTGFTNRNNTKSEMNASTNTIDYSSFSGQKKGFAVYDNATKEDVQLNYNGNTVKSVNIKMNDNVIACQNLADVEEIMTLNGGGNGLSISLNANGEEIQLDKDTAVQFYEYVDHLQTRNLEDDEIIIEYNPTSDKGYTATFDNQIVQVVQADGETMSYTDFVEKSHDISKNAAINITMENGSVIPLSRVDVEELVQMSRDVADGQPLFDSEVLAGEMNDALLSGYVKPPDDTDVSGCSLSGGADGVRFTRGSEDDSDDFSCSSEEGGTNQFRLEKGIRHTDYSAGDRIANAMNRMSSNMTRRINPYKSELNKVRSIARLYTFSLPLAQAGCFLGRHMCRKHLINRPESVAKVAILSHKAGIHSTVFYKRDRNGKLMYEKTSGNVYKPIQKTRLRAKDISLARKALDKQAKKLGLKVSLSHASKGELRKLAKKGEQGKAIVKAHKILNEMGKDIQKRNQALCQYGNNLKRGIDFLFREVEAYQGMKLMTKYVRAIYMGAKYLHKANKCIAKKLVRYDNPVKVKKRELKKEAKEQKIKAKKQKKRDKRQAKKNKRQVNRKKRSDKRWVKHTGKTKQAWKNAASDAMKNTKLFKGGKSIAGKIRKSKFAKGTKVFGSGAKKTFGTLSKAGGFVFGAVGNILSLPAKIKRYIMIGLAGMMLVPVIICLLGAFILIAVSKLTGSEVVTLDSNGNEISYVESEVNLMINKDNEYLKELKDVPQNTSVEDANNGEELYTAEDPFTGQKEKITGTSNMSASYFYYNALAWLVITKEAFKPEDLKKLPDSAKLNGYRTNAKDIIASANVYANTIDKEVEQDEDGTISNDSIINSFCQQLFDHTHAYNVSVSDEMQYCAGKDCKKNTVDCRAVSSLSEKKDFKGNSYDFNVESCNLTYYCNDETTWLGITFFEKSSKKTPNPLGCKQESKELKNEKTIYCPWSVHSGESDKMSLNIPAGAKSNTVYSYKGDSVILGDSLEQCPDYEAYTNSYLDADSVKTGIANGNLKLVESNGQLVTSSNGRYLLYVPNLQEYAVLSHEADVKTADGYILINKSFVDSTKKKLKANSSGTYSDSNGTFTWAYDCQGHKIDQYTCNYCKGHSGCKGHELSYCLGHYSLNVYVCIAGITESEVDAEDEEPADASSLFTVDNLFFNKNEGTYDSEWSGFETDDLEWAVMCMDADWKDSYDIPDSKFVLNTSP